METVVSFSGGRTSAYLCGLIKERYPAAKFIFMDTGAEHPATYEFIRKVNEHFALDLICLRAVFPPKLGKGVTWEQIDQTDIGYDLTTWRNMIKKYSTPYNPGGTFCTAKLKTEIFYKYCNTTFGKRNYQTWIGIRADESRRAKEKDNVHYLFELSDFDKEDIKEYWKTMPFDLELESDWLGNCVFCIKRGTNKLALAIRDEPELADDFINLIEAEDVRVVEGRKAPVALMYRGGLSLRAIRDMHTAYSRDDLILALQRGKKLDSVCSESCEAFEIIP